MIRVYLSGDPVHDRVLKAFYDGCPAEKQLAQVTDYEPSDVAVIFGVYKSKVPRSYPRGAVFRQQRSKNLDVIVLETGYINRGDGENHHYAAGFNGLNGRADFRNRNMPDDRARLLAVELRPWRQGSKILLCGQVPWDASVEGTNHYQWIQNTAAEIRRRSAKLLVFRPHPMAPLAPLDGIEYSTAPLKTDLVDAHCVVTFNSNSAVEAFLAGVPAFACDEGSMAWSICNRSLDDLSNPKKAERQGWLNDLAYAQWSLSEFRSGQAWAHLTRP